MNTSFFRVIKITYTMITRMFIEFLFLLLTVIDGISCLCSLGSVGMKCKEDFEDCILNAHGKNSTCEDLHPVSIHKYY